MHALTVISHCSRQQPSWEFETFIHRQVFPHPHPRQTQETDNQARYGAQIRQTKRKRYANNTPQAWLHFRLFSPSMLILLSLVRVVEKFGTLLHMLSLDSEYEVLDVAHSDYQKFNIHTWSRCPLPK